MSVPTRVFSKAKDLSHVPCKFFKVGSCTAGSSCPFSHAVLEPGQQKEVCAWFVKGNCKFGHKCALAHILPGQSMSMDRKNKKAAQAAASAANSSGREGHRSGRSQKSGGQGSQNGSSGSRSSLLSGSTAPTRSLSSSRSGIPMPLKATLSPSAPAPPVQNTDFASFGLPDESNKLPSAPAQGKPSNASSAASAGGATFSSDSEEASKNKADETNSVHPASPGRAYERSESADVSQPNIIASSPHSPTSNRLSQENGRATASPPGLAALSSSPFSAPGPQSIFMAHEQQRSADFKTRSGLSASLGAMNWGMGDAQSSTVGRGRYPGMYSLQDEVVVEDGELEEFIPGSLSDLLTPEERSRRFSRTNAVRPAVPRQESDIAPRDVLLDGPHHRHSRSVPAPSLLQDIRSIWTDTTDTLGGPDSSLNGIGITGGGLGNGTPSSFQSNSGFGGRDDPMAPSNASAAFLPGLHHYMNANPSQRSTLGSGLSSIHVPTPVLSSSLHPSAFSKAGGDVALSPPRVNAFTAGTTFDGRTSDLYLSQAQRQASARPIPTNDGFNGDADRTAFSPSTRALQAHAPGQSLPQGLAAGYSRIHALPPLASPSSTVAFSPGRSTGMSPALKGHLSSTSVDWSGSSAAAEPSTTPSAGGLESMFSRLSYSAAASRASIHPFS